MTEEQHTADVARAKEAFARAVPCLDLEDHRIIDIHLVANPDELRALAPLSATPPHERLP